MNSLVAIIFLPFLAALSIALIGEKNPQYRVGVVMGMPIICFVVLLANSGAILEGSLGTFVLADLDFFKIAFHVDPLSLLMGTLITFLWIFTSSYSFGYMAGGHALNRYFTFLTVCLGATMGIIFAADMMTFFIFYELLTIAVYPLVIHEETQESMRAGVVYLVFLLSGGAMVLFGIILTYYLTDGNITFTSGGIPQLAHQKDYLLYGLFFLFVAGFGVKGALLPFHVWLPRAMVAPTPISSLLHAVAVVNMGLYGFFRTIYSVFGADLFRQLHMNIILGSLASLTIIVAAISALRVDKIKRLLAYSTINQLSYVILGACSLHPMALLGSLVHVVYHSVMKITLFYSAGTIMKMTGKTKIKQMSGLARTMPITCAAFTVGALGISGLPPIAGWVSKWYLIEGFLIIKQPWFASMFIISTIIEIAFLSPPILYAYFGGKRGHPKAEEEAREKSEEKGATSYEAPLDMLIPLVVVAVLSITFGLFGSLPFIYAKAAVKVLMP